MTAATELFKIYLSLDCLDLILKAGDHAVQLSNLSLGCAQIITILSSGCLHLLKLKKKKKKDTLFGQILQVSIWDEEKSCGLIFTHLRFVPLLSIAPVAASNFIILSTDISHDGVHV